LHEGADGVGTAPDTYVSLVEPVRCSSMALQRQEIPMSKSDAAVLQPFGNLKSVRIGLAADVRSRSVRTLNRLLAHSMALRDLYKKAHWQTSGAVFYALHLMFDKHYEQQLELIDSLAERVQLLGGVALATSHDVVQETRLARVTSAAETPMQQLRGLIEAHEFMLAEARPLAREAAEHGDDGTNDIIVSEVIRTNELQSWFVGEHLDGQ
jgi:starvation-inducible DNA-binding protein